MQQVLIQISQTKSIPELWSLVHDYFVRHGVSKISYHHFAGLGAVPGEAPGHYIMAVGFAEEWVQHYVEDNLTEVDPIPELTRSLLRPFYWRDVQDLTPLTAAQRAYLQDMEEAHIGDGLAFQVFGPGMRNGYVGLGMQSGAERWSVEQATEFQVVGQAAHRYYCDLSPLASEPTVLSPREKEILRWMARGKSNGDIATILSVSRHTVDTMARRIFAKLDATDRTTASLRGIGAGMISVQDSPQEPIPAPDVT
jgi:LuxR family transcriptional regulator/LuxR family quorum-sensing system transcriptional regulator CciR